MRTLLLDKDYLPVRFLKEREAIRLLFLQKAEILATDAGLSTWPATHKLVNNAEFPAPAILRLLHVSVSFKNFKRSFSRKVVFSRDDWRCQYCGEKVFGLRASIDHVIPVSKGGKSEWLNCVTACRSCNSKKSNYTLLEANMTLLKQPTMPKLKHFWCVNNDYENSWHPDWGFFL